MIQSTPIMDRFQNLDLDQALRLIVEGTAADVGTDFYAALVKALAETLNTTGAWITEYLPESERLRALAFWLNGQWVSDYEYDLQGTPCQLVIKEAKPLHIPDNVTQLFPNDPDLATFNAVSYMGVPLQKEDGSVLGHLAILDAFPLPEDSRLLGFFRIFAARAAAEHRRLRADAEIREREEKLNRLISSAMDAIVEVDEDLKITVVNKAAIDLLAIPQEGLLGQHLKDRISAKGYAILSDLLKQLNKPNSNRHQVWIPAGLELIGNASQTLPVEATVSRSTSQRRHFYTLILRNLNQRQEAERQIRELTAQAEYLKEELKSLHNSDEIIGNSEAMLSVMRDVESVAGTDTTVLILGETGTGKELVARAIHNASRRSAKPLIKLNCAALPATLIESELFGHERGSFTGATAKRTGRFSLADHGTMFFDEVGELPLELQAKLLRVLQEGEFEPVGSSQTVRVDVRVIAATNRDLSKAVAEGKFREDLYYRLNVFPITVPPLRSRGEDIGLLAKAFLTRSLQKLGCRSQEFSPEDIARLNSYGWPGNVRELQNVIERAVIVSQDGRPNLARALPVAEKASARTDEKMMHVLTVDDLEELERKNILAGLERCNWKIAGDNGAAKLLGMKPSTLNSRISSLGIKRPNS